MVFCFVFGFCLFSALASDFARARSRLPVPESKHGRQGVKAKVVRRTILIEFGFNDKLGTNRLHTKTET